MNRKLIGLVLTVLALPVFANDSGKNYWVLGSFKVDGYAMQEAERMRQATGLEIEVAQYNLGGVVYNRVVLERTSSVGQQQIIDSTGIVPWTLFEGSRAVPRQLARAYVPERRVAQQQSNLSLMDRANAHQVVDVNPPAADVSYVDYCVQQANPRERELFCSDGMLRRVLTASVN